MLNDIITGTTSNVLAGIILAIFALLILDEKKVLRPWVYKLLSPFAVSVVGYLLKFLEIVVNPWTRIILIIYLLWAINYQGRNLLYSILVIATSITLFWRQKIQIKENPAPDISDGFEKLNTSTWLTKTGSPAIEKDFGKPAPALGLSMASPIQATNSFLLLKDDGYEHGVIECDFFLEPGSVFNIIFFCDSKNDNWHMARYDSRLPDSSDGFLMKDQGPGVNWRFHSMSGTHTPERQWHRARVEFTSEKASMYRDNDLIAEFSNPKIFGKSVGFFNEENSVHVDNFYISRQASK